MASEIYDWVSTCSPATPDYVYTLVIKAQGTVAEEGFKNQIVHLADDNSEEIVTLQSESIFTVSWTWAMLSEDNIGTIMDLYHDANKANGIAKTFWWLSYDGHTYVVRFDCILTRTRTRSQWGASGVKLRIKGRKVDVA